MKSNLYPQKIIHYLRSHHHAGSEEIASLLGISPASARRLTSQLEKDGVLLRFHGGVMLDPLRPPRPVANFHKKREIARYACSNFIKDGDTVYIGSGNTPGLMGEFFAPFKDLTVITNNLLLMPSLSAAPHIQTIFTGGLFNPNMPSMVGDVCSLDFLTDKFNINTCFVTSPAVSVQGCSQQETYVRQVIEEHFISLPQTTSFLLADTEKLGLNKSFRWAVPEKFSYLITNTCTEESKRMEQVFSIVYCIS